MLNRRERRIILQVDGSLGHRTELERAIGRERPGTSVRSFGDGESALEHLSLCGQQIEVPSVALVSLALPRPGPDGHEVLRAVRALAHLAPLPVILVHGDDPQEEVRRALLDLGAAAFLVRPVQKDEYTAFARAVVDWRAAGEESWPEVGPELAGSALALPGERVGSSPAMALSSDVAALFPPHPEDRSIMQRLVGFVDWVREQATATQDPFQAALTAACRRHMLTPTQAMRPGGSQAMRENRRLVVMDLYVQGWPDETILDALPINETELKRLKARARTKVGPKLDR